MPGAIEATQSSRWGQDAERTLGRFRDDSGHVDLVRENPEGNEDLEVHGRLLAGVGAGAAAAAAFFAPPIPPDHVERALGDVLELVVQDAFAPVQGILEADGLSRDPAELLGGEERLGEETFEPAGACDRLAVLRRELLHAQHGDDVLQVLVLGQRLANGLREVVVPLADDAGRGHLRAGLQEVDGGKEALARALAREHDRTRRGGRTHAPPPGRVRSSAGTYTAWIEVMAPAWGVGDALLQARQLRAHGGAGSPAGKASGP